MASNQDHLGSDSDSNSGSSYPSALHDGVAPPDVACHSQGAMESSYSADPAHLLPSSLGKADVEALFLCLVCEKILQDAVTLPCGKSICKTCIPPTHERVNVTYPDHPERRQGFHCPFNQCNKVHSIGDCGADVILNKLLDDIIQPLMKTLSEVDSDAHPEKQIFLDSLEAARPELDCQVCYGLYNDPITTGCGHTFCRACLYRTVDHSRHCPICRRDLTISPILCVELCPSNERLVNLIDQLWPQELMAKRQTTKLEEDALHQEFNMSLFSCTLSFPHMPTFLHVFEPRYKLMIRRALDGDRTFGMVFPNRWSRSSSEIPFYELGTLLRITNVEFYPDGRCLLETVGLSRFRVLRHSICDEYDVGKTERIDDVSVEMEEAIEMSEVTDVGRVAAERLNAYRQEMVDDGSTKSIDATKRPIMNLAEVEGMPTRDIMAFALDFVERMRNQGAIWTGHQSISIYGDCPTNPATFPWWLASVLPVKMRQKYLLLATTSVRARLKICSAWMLEWETRTWLAMKATLRERKAAL